MELKIKSISRKKEFAVSDRYLKKLDRIRKGKSLKIESFSESYC
jgi:hypothetical protein